MVPKVKIYTFSPTKFNSNCQGCNLKLFIYLNFVDVLARLVNFSVHSPLHDAHSPFILYI